MNANEMKVIATLNVKGGWVIEVKTDGHAVEIVQDGVIVGKGTLCRENGISGVNHGALGPSDFSRTEVIYAELRRRVSVALKTP